MNNINSQNSGSSDRPNFERSTPTEGIFRLLVDAVEDYAIFALDPKGFILTWNLGGQKLKGYSAEEVIGSHFSRFYTKPDIDKNHPQYELEQAVLKGKYEEEGWRLRKDGSVFWANVVITTLRDSNGQIQGFGKVTRDLSAKRTAELALKDSEERFRLLVSNVNDYAIITLDPAGKISSWNPGAQRIKGYKPSEIIGKHFSIFYPVSEVQNEKPQMELRIAEEEGGYEEEGWRVRKDGTMFWANVNITPMRVDTPDGKSELRGFAKVTRDLTSRRQSEEALRQSQERYRLLIDNVSDYALMLLDPRGRVTSWNAGATKIMGYESREILGGHFSKFYRKSDLDAKKPELELKTAIEVGRFEEEGIRVRKDGSEYWANIILTAIKDEHGNLRGFSKVTRDLSEIRASESKLKESEERFRLMIESVADYAIFMLDPQGYIITWNKGAERNKGYTAEEIIGQHFSKFYPESDNKANKPTLELKEALKSGRYEEEGWRLRKDGSKFWASVVITPVSDKNGLIGFAKVTRNLTERKKSEDELKAAYANLEARIEERTKELSEAKTNAENAVKARDQFFSMASHELKTPLSSLKLQSQIRRRSIARGDFSDFAPDKLAELCEDDDRQVSRLSVLVDNMLDISKLTSGNFEITTELVDPNDVVTGIIKSLSPAMKQAGCDLTFVPSAEPIQGHWDRHRLEQVLINLLTNAMKYAAKKPVVISVAQVEDRVRFSVKDQGKGISEGDQARIFEPFERVRSQTNVSGLGLGLHIVRQIVEAHGGTIRIHSRLNEGSEFIVELPILNKSK